MAEWKTIGDICEIIRGNGVQKTDFVENGLGCIHYGQIYTHYGAYTYSTKTFVSQETFEKARKASKGDIIMTDTSENVEDICKSVAYLGEDDIAISNHTLILKHKQNPKFLSYSTQTNSFFNQKRKYVVGVKVSGIKPEQLAKIKIYLPSLSEQNRIVDILDTFTASIDNLKEQITLRRKQYEYYRDQLLDLEGKPGVEMIKLGIVCKIGDGIHGTPLYDENGDYYFVNGNNLSNGKIVIKPDTKRVNEEMFAKYGVELDKSTILMSINGTIGNIAYYNNERLVLGKSAAYFKVTNKNLLDNRYLYYLLQATKSIDYYDGMLTGSTIKNLGIKALRNYAVPVPPLQEQQRIVSILDTFEASIQNLEAQLAQREKQYEYYRNKLLTFE